MLYLRFLGVIGFFSSKVRFKGLKVLLTQPRDSTYTEQKVMTRSGTGALTETTGTGALLEVEVQDDNVLRRQ